MWRLAAVPFDRARGWVAASVNRRILAAAVTVGGLTLVVKIASVLKELVSAFQFGAGRELDALLIAWALPTFIINVLGGSLQAAFVPVYLDVRSRNGVVAATRLVESVAVAYVVLLAVVSLALGICSPWLLHLMGMGFTDSQLSLCQHLFCLLLPIILLTGLARLCGGILIAHDRFALTTVSTIATPLCSIGCMLLLVNLLGIYSLAVGILFGALLELLIVAKPALRLDHGLVLHWHRNTAGLNQILSQYFPVVMGSALMAGTVLTDQAMAGLLPAGGVSILNYANKVPAVMLGLTSAAIGTAVLPYFSRMVTACDWPGIRRTLRVYSAMITAVLVPVTILLILASGLIVRYVFEHGAFTAGDSKIVAWVQILFLVQVPFYTLGILAVRLISALQANQILMWGSMLSLILNGILDYVLMQHMGVAGIALATSLIYVVAFAYLFFMLTRILNRREMIAHTVPPSVA